MDVSSVPFGGMPHYSLLKVVHPEQPNGVFLSSSSALSIKGACP
jgi:hypothetical protein